MQYILTHEELEELKSATAKNSDQIKRKLRFDIAEIYRKYYEEILTDMFNKMPHFSKEMLQIKLNGLNEKLKKEIDDL